MPELLTRAETPQSAAGRVAGFKSEWWPDLFRNGGRHQIGTVAGFASEYPAGFNRNPQAHIDHAFARPVTRSDNVAEYAATQVLAEVFRLKGYDGLIYRSAFSAEGYNVALFDLDCAHQLDASIFTVRRATYEFSEIGTRYASAPDRDDGFPFDEGPC